MWAELATARFKVPVKHAAGSARLIVAAERDAAVRGRLAAAAARFDAHTAAAAAAPDGSPDAAAADAACRAAAESVLAAKAEQIALHKAGGLRLFGVDPALVDLYRDRYGEGE